LDEREWVYIDWSAAPKKIWNGPISQKPLGIFAVEEGEWLFGCLLPNFIICPRGIERAAAGWIPISSYSHGAEHLAGKDSLRAQSPFSAGNDSLVLEIFGKWGVSFPIQLPSSSVPIPFSPYPHFPSIFLFIPQLNFVKWIMKKCKQNGKGTL
jgi:hypothetical protein